MEPALISPSKPLIIELTGTPGAGKTILLPTVADFLREQGWQAYTVVGAARRFTQRTLPGALISLIGPERLRQILLWQAFLALSTLHRFRFFAQRPALKPWLVQSQMQRPPSADVQKRKVLPWFFRLVGEYDFLSHHAYPAEALLFDDGLVHRVVHLFASDVETPDEEAIAHYLDFIPPPDLLIVVNAPLQVCKERVYQRGVWDHSRHKSPAELEQYLLHAEQTIHIALKLLKAKGWSIIEIDNSGTTLRHPIQELRQKMTKLSLFAKQPVLAPTPPLLDETAPRFVSLPRPARFSAYLRSRLRPPDIEIETVQAVLKQYDLPFEGAPQNLPLSRRTRNVIIHTPFGKKVLKRYRTMLPMSTIAYSHSILKRLAEINFPAPRLVLTPAGNDLITHEHNTYALFDFVEGDSYSLSFLLPVHRQQLMWLAGQTLARFHSILEGFVPEGRHHLGFTSYSGNWQRDLVWYAGKTEELKEKSQSLDNENARTHALWLIQNSDYILDELEELDEFLRNTSLPRLIVHGDFGLHNLIFPRHGPITMMDFETARIEWRLSDLVSALSRLRYGNGQYNFESIQSFVAGYQAVYPLSAEEWELLPAVWRFHKLRSALIYWNSYFETGGPVDKLLNARDAVAQADWALNNPEKLSHLNILSLAHR